MGANKNKSMISRITESRNFGLILGLIVLLIIAAIITPSVLCKFYLKYAAE